jgi:multimeric flavodoxin WrbA
MKRVLGLVGSNRKLGNSEIMVKEIFKHMEGDCELSLIRLFRLDLRSCKGCYACLLPDAACSIEDDYGFVLDEIARTDYLIIAAPCYWLGAVAPIKCMIDRTFEAFPRRETFEKIRTVTVLTAGMEIFSGHGDMDLNVLAREAGLNLVDSCVACGTLPGEVVLDEENIKSAKRLARALSDASYERDIPPNRCPTCWSDVFRIKADLSLECPTCAAQANYVLTERNERKIEFLRHGRYREGEHEHDHYVHFDWLLNKKSAFEEKKDMLNEIRETYKNIGTWKEPVRNS